MGRAIVVLLVAAALGTAPAAGAPAQTTPRVGGTAHFGLGAIEPTCLNVLLARCVTLPAAFFVAGAVLEPAFAVGADSTFRPGLVAERDLHAEGSVRVHLPDRPAGEMERRRADHGT